MKASRVAVTMLLAFACARPTVAFAANNPLVDMFRGLAELVSRMFGGSGSQQDPSYFRRESGSSHDTLGPGESEVSDGYGGTYVIPMPPPSKNQSLGAIGSEQNLPPGKVLAIFPKDRCQSGWIYFGNQKCSVLGRGASGRESDLASGRASAGEMSNGRRCVYLNSNVKTGATPVGNYRIRAEDPGSYKPHWGNNGVTRKSYIMDPNVPQPPGVSKPRTNDLFIHSDQATGQNMDYRSTWGCIKMDAACQQAFVQYMDKVGSADLLVTER